MKIEGEAKLLRIMVGSSDKVDHQPLYEFIVFEAKRFGLAGATVLKGIMGFGANSVVHMAKILDISDDMPIIIELVDQSEKIDGFIKSIESYFEDNKYGVLITAEKVNIIKYSPSKNKK